MITLTITNTCTSTVACGDPEVVTFALAPGETKSAKVTEAQLKQLIPSLDKLVEAKWISCSTEREGAEMTASAKEEKAPAPVVEAPPAIDVPASMPPSVDETPAPTSTPPVMGVGPQSVEAPSFKKTRNR